jgi:hypothetical protein
MCYTFMNSAHLKYDVTVYKRTTILYRNLTNSQSNKLSIDKLSNFCTGGSEQQQVQHLFTKSCRHANSVHGISRTEYNDFCIYALYITVRRLSC